MRIRDHNRSYDFSLKIIEIFKLQDKCKILIITLNKQIKAHISFNIKDNNLMSFHSDLLQLLPTGLKCKTRKD